MAERLDIVSQSNFPTNKSNTVEIVTTTKKKVTTASASDIATLVTPAISNLDIATQTNFPIQSSDAQSDFIITTDGGVNNVTAEAAAGLISSYIPTGGGDPHKPDFTADYSTNYSDFSNFTGSGTEADPYQIWDEEMFLNARFKVNNGGLSSATYFKQMRDIVWHFDGIGFCMTAGTFYIYDTDNTELLDTAFYGSSTAYQYFNYEGGLHTLNVHLDDFTFNTDFVANLINFTAPHGKITTSTTSNSCSLLFSFIAANIIKDLTFSLKGKFYSSLSFIYWKLLDFKTKLENVTIKDSQVIVTSNNSKFEQLILNNYSSAEFKNIKIINCNVVDGNATPLISISCDTNNLLIENCDFSNTYNYIYNTYYSKDINYLHINNCIIKCMLSNTNAMITGGNIYNCLIENTKFYSGSASYVCYLVKADYIYNSCLKNLYVEGNSFYGFNVNYKIYGCSFLGSIWCKQLDNNGEFYLCRSVGSSALPEGEYTVNYCKNSAVFMVDSNSYTYNLDTHAYLGADTTDSSGDSEGVVIANI
ncbi:MAG: hypothetical protein IJ890_00135 [Clostridia bacterium]|nr:hypothetical protein [Clostridia bacterium]